MNMLAKPQRYTPEEFERLSEADGYELLDGYLAEKGMGAEASFIQNGIGSRLREVVRAGRLGFVLDSECMYQCFPTHPRRVRKPDVSFVAADRVAGGRLPRGMFRIRPDLAVEVVSPNDEFEKVDDKVADYFDAGVPLVWIVSPKTQTVLVYQADGSARRLTATDDLTADPVVPGFRVRVADLFPNPPEPPDDDAPVTEPPAA